MQSSLIKFAGFCTSAYDGLFRRLNGSALHLYMCMAGSGLHNSPRTSFDAGYVLLRTKPNHRPDRGMRNPTILGQCITNLTRAAGAEHHSCVSGSSSAILNKIQRNKDGYRFASCAHRRTARGTHEFSPRSALCCVGNSGCFGDDLVGRPGVPLKSVSRRDARRQPLFRLLFNGRHC